MRHTVLIVDDMVENIDILKNMLTDLYDIKIAVNGKMALKVAELMKPDIILLDIMMPDLNGYEVCKRLKANPITHNIPIIFVTSKDHEIDEVKGFEVGAVDYVTKPISPLTVKARLRTQLALKDQSFELERQVRFKTKEINDTRYEIVKRLGRAVEQKDGETGRHVERMSQYMLLIAASYGLEENDMELLKMVAPMHDVGKIGIPESILCKKGPLTGEEFDIIKTHCDIGGSILSDSDTTLIETSRIIALQHHEKWNGKGYPIGLSGESIHCYARIAAAADVFDALTSKRPYKEAWDVNRAIALMQTESGEHFDPKVIDAFMNVIDDIIKVYEHTGDE